MSLSLFLDIDGTITDYIPGALAPEKLLHGNFLFPILQSFLKKKGISAEVAAELILQETQKNIFWSYTGIMKTLDIPIEECTICCRKWHQENLSVYSDTIQFIQFMQEKNIPIYIISNNPCDGCRWKLERAGLCTPNGTLLPPICRIFGTDNMLGCKFRKESWERALSLTGLSPNQVVTLGDDLHEDGEVPQKNGILKSFIIHQAENTLHCQNPNIIKINYPMDFNWDKFLKIK